MNQVIIHSWYFLKNNIQKLAFFVFPFFMVTLFSDVLGIYDPNSTLKKVIEGVDLIFIFPLFNGGLLLLIHHLANNETLSFTEIISKVIPYWVPLFLVSIISGFLVGVGFFAFVIPGVWLILRLLLSPLYVIFQDLTATEAISRAFKNSKFSVGEHFYALLPFIVISIIMFFVGSKLPYSPNLFFAIVQSLFVEFLFVLISIIQYRLYINYMEREEAVN